MKYRVEYGLYISRVFNMQKYHIRRLSLERFLTKVSSIKKIRIN